MSWWKHMTACCIFPSLCLSPFNPVLCGMLFQSVSHVCFFRSRPCRTVPMCQWNKTQNSVGFILLHVAHHAPLFSAVVVYACSKLCLHFEGKWFSNFLLCNIYTYYDSPSEILSKICIFSTNLSNKNLFLKIQCCLLQSSICAYSFVFSSSLSAFYFLCFLKSCWEATSMIVTTP